MKSVSPPKPASPIVGSPENPTSDALTSAPKHFVPCIHCGLPTQVVAHHEPEEPVFCCSGCRGAYELIHGWGLSDFYALRDQMTATGAAQAAGSQTSYEQFNSPEYLGYSAPTQHADGMCSAELGVQGLHCAACAWLIEKATMQEAGLQAVRVKMSDHTVRVVFDPELIQLSSIARLLDRLGYRLLPLDRKRENHLQQENRRLLVQIAISGFLAANAMWIAVALYAGQFSGVATEHKHFFGLIGMSLGVAAVAGPGRTFFTGALASLRTRTPHMDIPVALGLSVGTLFGVYHAISGVGDIYFDSLTSLVFLLLIGRWIQFRQQHRAARAVDMMLRITPRHAELVHDNGSSTTVLVDRLQNGDTVRVAAGESVPADGCVTKGSSLLNRSLLTGESQPIALQVGSKVEAGTINLSGPIELRVEAVGSNSRIGQVMQAVEMAAAEKSPIVQLADRIGGVFVVVVTLLAVATFLVWLPSSISLATSHATSLLIVACPCALALATPLAISVGIGRAAQAGILIRDGQSLQQLAKPGMIWFDKTGTLTQGKQQVRVVTGDSEALQLAASLEESCQHPVGEAIRRLAHVHDLAPLPDTELIEYRANGIRGRVGDKSVAVGNLACMRELAIELPNTTCEQAETLLEQGESPIVVAVNGKFAALLAVTDPLRGQALHTIQQLQELGWRVGMLSGDHQAIASQIGARLGLEPQDCHGGVSPEEKLAAIRQSRREFSSVVMVGDGANDAAALAASDVGIAVRGGAEASLVAAPVYMASGKLAGVVDLIRGAVRTTQVIYLSFAVSLAYNLIAVLLAMTGWISPLMAAVLMPLSSASVLALTFAIPKFERPVFPKTTSQREATDWELQS